MSDALAIHPGTTMMQFSVEIIRLLAEIVIAAGVIYNAALAIRGKAQRKVLIEKIEEVHAATNGMQEALVKVTSEEALARGKLEGAAEEQAKANT
jgi:hypothetical protein